MSLEYEFNCAIVARGGIERLFNGKSEIHHINSRDTARSENVLVEYGDQYGQTKHELGFTITVARQQSKSVSELSFLTAIHTAKGVAKTEGISEIFACK